MKSSVKICSYLQKIIKNARALNFISSIEIDFSRFKKDKSLSLSVRKSAENRLQPIERLFRFDREICYLWICNASIGNVNPLWWAYSHRDQKILGFRWTEAKMKGVAFFSRRNFDCVKVTMIRTSIYTATAPISFDVNWFVDQGSLQTYATNISIEMPTHTWTIAIRTIIK